MNTNERAYRYRPSADRLGSAYHRHGPLVPMDTPREPIWRRWFKGGRHG